MTDLTKITTPFGLLDKDTQRRLREHGGPYESYRFDHTRNGQKWAWHECVPHWSYPGTVVRVKQTPQITTQEETRWAVFEVGGLSLYRSKTLGKEGGGVRGVLNTTYRDDKPIRAVWEADKD